MGRVRSPRGFLAIAVAFALFTPASAHAEPAKGSAWTDVPSDHWARKAIDFVARQNSWMRDYGDTQFKPKAIETRRYLARAVVLAFAPDDVPDPAITFDDMPPSDPFWRYANVAVKRHWIPQRGESFFPDLPVTMTNVHVALVRAVGLGDVARGVDAIHTTDGYAFEHQKNLGALEIGMHLGLRFNHSDESLDVRPHDQLPRSEIAWSLYRAYVAKTQESWRITSLRSGGFKTIHLGKLSPEMRTVVEFGLRFVGYPYVYAGEWYQPTPKSYCCGPQPQGGFDCSGFTWWLMKAPSGSFDNTAIRGYRGWDLPQRSSRDMASVGRRIAYNDLKPGDLMFYSGSGNGVVDHVDVYLGWGWAIDSSSSIGGVTLLRVNDGWYRDRFVHARRIVRP